MNSNYLTNFAFAIRKHIIKTISFIDTRDMPNEQVKNIARSLASDGAVPIPHETYELISKYYQFIHDKKELLVYNNNKALWDRKIEHYDLDNFLYDYFTILHEISIDKNDMIHATYANSFFSGSKIHVISERIKRSMPLCIDHSYELIEQNENIRYFNLYGPDSKGGTIRGIIDMSKNEWNLEGVTWKDSIDRHLTQILPQPLSVDESDEPKLWLDLIDEYMEHDQELIKYFKRVLAYIMSPYNFNQCLIFFYGMTGKNGKSTILKVLMDILGTHSIRLSSDLLVAKPPMNFKKDDALAAAEGKSLFVFNEVDERAILSTQNIKDITEGGRDDFGNKIRTTVRPAFSPAYGVCIQGTPLIACNSLLNMGEWASLDSVFRRTIIVPFNHTIDVEDPTIPSRLAKIYPQIQLWLYRNYFEHKQRGDLDLKTNRPQIVDDILVQYYNDSDLIKQFFEECVEFTGNDLDMLPKASIFKMYEAYCKYNGRNSIKNKGTNGFQELHKKYLPKEVLCSLYKTNGIITYRRCKRTVFFENIIAPATSR